MYYQAQSSKVHWVQLDRISYGKIFVFGGHMYVKVMAPRLYGQRFVPCVSVGTINNNGIQYFYYSSLVGV